MIKRAYITIFKTLGTMISTAKDSFMSGYHAPYHEASFKQRFEEDDMDDSNKSTFIRDVS